MLSKIPDCSSHNFGNFNSSVNFEDILNLYNIIEEHGHTSVHHAINSVLLRLIEVGFLHDTQIQRIGSLWDSLGNNAPIRLRDRISFLTGYNKIDIPDSLVNYLSKILSGTSFQKGRREANYNDFFDVLVERNINSNRYKNLICESCGYHFREADLGIQRCTVAKDIGAIFARNAHPLRENNNDLWKPQYIDKKNDPTSKIYLTILTIDHIVPEEGLGWSNSDNLQLTCKLCNNGKMAYRRPLEAVSLFAAGGLSDYPEDRPWNMLKQSIVSFTYEYNNRTCSICNNYSSDGELTVRPKKRVTPADIRNVLSFAPWNYRAICYSCISKNPDI